METRPPQPKLISKHISEPFWVLSFPFHRDIVESIKSYLPGAWFQAEPMKAWYLPVNPEWTGRLAWFANQHGFHFDNRANKLLHQHKMEELETNRALQIPVIPTLTKSLRHFQIGDERSGVERMLRDKRVLVADEMGLGKTIQDLAAIEGAEAYPAIIVCPASVKHKWEREIAEWLPHRTSIVLNGKKIQELDSDFVILNYEILEKHQAFLNSIDAKSITFDESQYLKNRDAKRTKAARSLASGIEYIYLLTGTPIVNRPLELTSQLEILGRLGDFGGFWNFAHHYCGAKKVFGRWDMSGATNLDKLNEKLHDICFFRRLKRDVLSELPALERSIVPMEISNRAEYDLAEEKLLKWLKREKEDKHLKGSRGEQMVRIEKLKQLAAKGKMAFVTEFVNTFIESGEKLVLYATHKEIQKQLLEIYPDAAHILGDDSHAERKRNNERFQNDPDCTLIICSLKAANTGIDLFAASNVAFVELGWTPSEHDQAEARPHRMGQESAVNAWYLIAERTIDEEIAALLDRKRMIISAATEGVQEEKAVAEIVDNLLTRMLHEEMQVA